MNQTRDDRSAPVAKRDAGATELRLAGLDGSTPLGFLAALGLLRVLSQECRMPHATLHWVAQSGAWSPTLRGLESGAENEPTLLALLERTLVSQLDEHPLLLLETLASADRRRLFEVECLRATRSARMVVDWMASIASDFAPPEAINQLQTVRRDYYVDNIRSVLRQTSRDHLRRTLFVAWDYADSLDNQSLHLDPSEDRRHAHQWNQPAGDPDRKCRGGMLGANRLAIEALPLFTSLPGDDALRTVGFTGNRSTNTRWTWPLWGVPLSLSVLRSLLQLADLQAPELGQADIAELRGRGILAVFRTSRILVQKTPNFTPPRRIA